MTIRLLMTRRWPEEVEHTALADFEATLNRDDRAMTTGELRQAACDYDVICPTVSDRLGAEMFDQPRCRVRLVANYGAGFDHIDLAACRSRGIVVTNTPDILTDATAELALLLMLMVARRAGEGERELRAGQWTGWRPTHLQGRQVTGKTLGLVGFGRIAQATAAKALGLGMRVLYHSRTPVATAVERALKATYHANLTDMLASSDFVSLHCPGGPATEGLIDATALAAMRPGAVLINTARGSVVDEAAPAAALHSGHLGGAGLDVFRGEPAVSPNLLAAPNLVMLPHLGSATVETRVAMGERALANVRQWIAGEGPRDRVA